MLREHKERLESRMRILEEHNQQLVSQLGKLKMFMEPGETPNGGLLAPNLSSQASAMITTNKTGTLNTKSVTASQLATNSPVMTHRMVAAAAAAAAAAASGYNSAADPPALPPRGMPRPGQLSREGSLSSSSSKPAPPAVPPKRSSLTRSDLALFDAVSLTH